MDIAYLFLDIENQILDVEKHFFDVAYHFVDIEIQILDVENPFVDICYLLLNIENQIMDIENPFLDIENQIICKGNLLVMSVITLVVEFLIVIVMSLSVAESL